MNDIHFNSLDPFVVCILNDSLNVSIVFDSLVIVQPTMNLTSSFAFTKPIKFRIIEPKKTGEKQF